MFRVQRWMAVFAITAAVVTGTQEMEAQKPGALVPAPDRRPDEGQGPYDKLIIRGVTVIDGTGAAPMGPMDVVVEHNKIVDVVNVGAPHVPIDEKRRPAKTAHEIDGTGMYLMPGFVDTHTHYGDPNKAGTAEYVNKLWLAHGVTTVRGVPAGPLDWALHERERSAKDETVAPRIFVYQPAFTGDGWKANPVLTPELGREWVRFLAAKGADGIKLFGGDPDVVEAILDEGKKNKMGSLAHLGQESEPRLTARIAVDLGLRTVTHSYGLFESLLKDTSVQDYPLNQNYSDEYMRFGQVARNWDKIYPRGSDEWNAFLLDLKAHNAVMNPTMVIYSAGRDLMRAYTSEWHDKYTLPSLMDYYQPDRSHHGSIWYYWTTEDEYAYKNYYRVWGNMIKDYNQMGGHVTTGTDAGFIYQTYGFAFIEELELLREAGLSPLEVIRSATLYGAEELQSPKQTTVDFGIIRPGKFADMVIVDQNPLENLKVLYGDGWMKLNDDTGKVERVGGIKYVVKDGIVYEPKKLLADVAAMVDKQKKEYKGKTVIRQGVPVVMP
ncbi:amidohydrolase family protein [Terriglobus saanensis]|uniref:Amidohydrolase n=1 Tax=Terriglobus saanensis (strain ATCC BAA-1853 / DSM 23119 / SP1PR4) TaxID=401053 RepID=E8V8S9_TERSS|nr:amidohydrolase family protein [Terriglobus saanensis]ADV84116.1 amidohydrolase [Terriglobus saanensis SP1PR4]